MADDLADQLRKWREQAGLSQEDLADVLKVKQQTVSDWERGRSKPSYRRAPALDDALRLTPGTLAAALQDPLEGAAARSGVDISDLPQDDQQTVIELVGFLRARNRRRRT